MSEIDFIPSWIYTILIAPIALVFQKHFSLSQKVAVNSTKITTLENMAKTNCEKLDATCTKLDEVAENVAFIRGLLERNKN